MDEEQVQSPAENAPAVEDNSPAASPAPEPTTSEQETVDSGEIQESDETDGSERKPTRAERRIRELSDKVKQYEQSNQQPVGSGQSPLPALDVAEYADETGNLDVNALNQAINSSVVQTSQAIAGQTVNSALAQLEAKNNFNLDLNSLQDNEVLKSLPEVEQAITEEFEQRAFKVVGYNPVTGQPIQVLDPSVRLADIAKRHLKVVEAAAKKSSAETKVAVDKAADESAIKPGTTPKTQKDLSQMSREERMRYIEQKHGSVRR